MARYRHYRNPAEMGATLFVTTTVLDFVHAFRRDEPRDAMVVAIARECQRAQVALYAFVVMPHHLHMLIRLPEKTCGPDFMRVFKRQSSRTIQPLLTAEELRGFDAQRGLNGNTFWQRSFRSLAVEGEEIFLQKMRYIHENPVRAGYVEMATDYRWSSAGLVADGLISEVEGLPFDQIEQDHLPYRRRSLRARGEA